MSSLNLEIPKWVVVIIIASFGSLLYYGIYYLGYPTRDPNI